MRVVTVLPRQVYCVDANKDEHVIVHALKFGSDGQNIDDANNQILSSMLKSFNINNIGLRITNWLAQNGEPTAINTMRMASKNQDSGLRTPNVPVYPTVPVVIAAVSTLASNL